ncbi:hypothetical protein GCM10009830_02420 [Glycomyces endophyticus]|uniref:PPE family protein n=1 Tax=Glycomyces endophyticus TaxID=480996 RepID=A0ABN2FW67_9ACTN
MSTGQHLYEAGEAMSPYYNGVIKSCAVAIAPPAIVFGLAVQAMATSVYLNQCNPGDVLKAAGAWVSLAEKNTEAADALQAEVDTVTDDNWSGDDADAFREAAGNVKAQLQQLAVTAFLIGAQLLAFSVMLTVYWLFLTACTVVMDAFLAAYLAALAGVLTAPGAPAIMASAQTVATSLVASMKSIESYLITVSTGCATLTGGLTAITFGFQKANGNPVDPLDVAGAGLANMLEGFLVYGVNVATMTPGGRHANVANAMHVFQGVSAIFPTYKGDGETGALLDGGGPALGIPDSLLNLWEDHAPDRFTNPESVKWRLPGRPRSGGPPPRCSSSSRSWPSPPPPSGTWSSGPPRAAPPARPASPWSSGRTSPAAATRSAPAPSPRTAAAPRPRSTSRSTAGAPKAIASTRSSSNPRRCTRTGGADRPRGRPAPARASTSPR